ncbi:MAG: nucleotide sugar dehydrogenase [Melioribacteraceae bacterium]|nr:nucleotide sugar dehydrogenase [Melioribacteraceae bacterium]
MTHKTQLLTKITSRSAKIGVIGLGYVGLPLALTFAEKGFKVTGFDIDEKKIPMLNSGESYIKHIPSSRIKSAVDSTNFEATSDFSRLTSTDVIIICVPTPLDEHREPDLSYVENSAYEVSKYLKKGQLVVLESSTYPGTTDEVLLPILEQGIKAVIGLDPDDEDRLTPARHLIGGSSVSRFTVGDDFFLAFSPEREDPNNPDYTTSTIPKVVGGVTCNCLEVACALYDQVIVKTVPVSSARAAEATKLLENIFRSINIALVNELKMVFDRMDIDIWDVINAAKTKPFGFMEFQPGPGLGGHCIPIDPFYLTWKAREYDINTKFIELAGEINTYQPYYVVEKTRDLLNKHGKSLSQASILILGASYKKNIDDTRESPSLKLIELFQAQGARVDYHDPYIQKLPPTRKYNFDLSSVTLTSSSLASYDLVLLSTDHDSLDYDLIAQHSKLIIDTRNVFERKGIKSEKIFKA